MTSALPKAVRQQIEEANRLSEELARGRQVAEPQVNSPVNEPAAEAAPEPQAAPPQEETGWEQKYRVLQGKYNAEVPRLQRQMNDSSQKIEQLQQQLIATQGMLASFGQRSAAPESVAAPQQRLVKDDEINTFGKDLHDFVSRAAQDAVGPLIDNRVKSVQQEVEAVRGSAQQANQRAAQTDQQRVLTELGLHVPNWRQLNHDQAFLEWLDIVDPYANKKRGELLHEAYRACDVPRVVAFFQGFQTEHATVAPATAAPAPAKQAQAGSQRQLDEFTAPGAKQVSGATSAPDGTNKRIWTEKDVNQFYKDCTMGKYRTNQKRRDELERDIHAAVAEGRFR